MKNILAFLFILLIPAIMVSQDLNIPNNPYDKADDYNKSKKAFNRERWFFEQRMYPNNYIPENVYTNAYNQRENLRTQNGFFLTSKNVFWTNLGPTPGSYFSYGNISSRIVTIKVDPNNPQIIYIGAAYGGIWKTTDGGTTWTPKTDFQPSLSSGAIAIDPTNTNIIYYGTGEATYSGASYYGRGLLKSTNGGDTWTQYTTGLPSLTYFSRLVIRPGHPSELLAAIGNNGLYRSTNAGASWTAIMTNRTDDVLFSVTGDTAFCSGSQGIKISYNAGVSFTYTATGYTAGTRNHLAFCKSSPNIFYASYYSGSTVNIYKSTDKAQTFTQVSAGFNFNGGQAWYDFYMHVNPFDPDYAYVGAVDIFRTTNGGTNFSNITNGYGGGNVHVDQHNFEFHPTNPDICWCVSDGGVWMSTNRGTSFTNLNNNLTLTQFYRIASNPSDAAQILGGTQDNGTQQTRGTLNWTGAFGGDGGEVCFQTQNNLYIIGESQNNGMMRSVNGGFSWSGATTGMSGSGAWVAPIISHPDSAGIFYTARNQVFKTNDNGGNWTAISSGTNGSTIREMAICKSNPSTIFVTIGSQVYKSQDGGYNFVNTTNGIPNRTITSINIHPDSPKDAIVTLSGFGSGKIFMTTDGGASWYDKSGNLPDSPVNDGMYYYPGFATSYLLVAMDIGVFLSTNNGANWTELADGLPNTVAMHLDFNRASGKIRIGTHGRGVWELNGAILGIVNYNSEIPKGYSLKQNYPNPFNPSTKISFAITKSGYVTLKVYNSLGQEVKSLVNEFLKAGSFDVNFQSENLPSGAYYYRLTANDFTEAKTMILMK